MSCAATDPRDLVNSVNPASHFAQPICPFCHHTHRFFPAYSTNYRLDSLCSPSREARRPSGEHGAAFGARRLGDAFRWRCILGWRSRAGWRSVWGAALGLTLHWAGGQLGWSSALALQLSIEYDPGFRPRFFVPWRTNMSHSAGRRTHSTVLLSLSRPALRPISGDSWQRSFASQSVVAKVHAQENRCS
jgi:hypothetical protein